MRVIDTAMGAAWAMEEPALRQLLEIAHRENSVTPEALEAYRAASLEGADEATVRDGVAIITANGPLFKRANLMTALSGATSYEVLIRDFTTALNDGNVKAILWNIDSPGGEAAGCAELAAVIASSRGEKPIVAYVSDLASSAAYWIASACDKIILGPSAAVGSIGVRASLSDTSARDARTGVTKFEFVSSQSPFKISDPKTADGAGRIQARVDALATVFVGAVAANRGVSVAQALESFGQGDVFVGQAAIDAGMADGFGTFESVLAMLARDTEPEAAPLLYRPAALRGFNAKGETMPTTAEMNAAIEAALEEQKTKLSAEHEKAIAAATEKASADASASATTAAEKAERARVAALNDSTFAGYEKERDEAIQTGSSVADFRALIVEKEYAKAKARASAVDKDVEANAQVPPASVAVEASDEDKAFEAIMGATALARK